MTSHSAHVLPHQNDPNYVPVMVWQPGLGTDLQYKPANDRWTCVANSEAEDIGYEDCGA